MNKMKLLTVPLLMLTLISCTRMTGELYENGQFESEDFTKNYYRVFPNALQTATLNKSYPLTNENSRIGEYSNSNYTKSLLEEDVLRSMPGADRDYKQLYTADNTGIVMNPYVAADEYYKRKSLGAISESFKYGYFSKLTDGLTHCDGTGAHVRIQIDEQGIGHLFEKELIEYPSFILSLRGGTNVPWGTNGLPNFTSATYGQSTIGLTFSFHTLNSDLKTYTRTDFTKTITIQTDDNGYNTNILQFYFRDVITDESERALLKRAVGFSVSYELLDHAYLKPGGVAIASEYEYALMLYEVAFPYSKWN